MRRRSRYSTPKPPEPIKIQKATADLTALSNAYDMYGVSVLLSVRMSVQWYLENTPLLVVQYGVTEQKAHDRATKAAKLAEGTTVENESIQAYSTAIKLFEKVWPAAEIPKLDTVVTNLSNGKPSRRAEALNSTLTAMNTAFGFFNVKYVLTPTGERSFNAVDGVTNILIPGIELVTMAETPLLKNLLNEALTVAKVTSVVETENGTELDGGAFMEALPKVYDAVYEWVAANAASNMTQARDLSSKPAASPKGPKAPRQPGTVSPRSKLQPSMVVTVLNNPNYRGMRGAVLNTIASGMTYGDCLNHIHTLYPTIDVKSYLKFYVETGNIEVK